MFGWISRGPLIAAALALGALAVTLGLTLAAAPPVPAKLGLVAPFSGRDAALGRQLLGAVQLALADRPAADRIARPIELVAYDDGTTPAGIERQARKLIVDPRTVAVVGHPALDSATVAAPLYAAAGLPAWLTAPAFAPPDEPVLAAGIPPADLPAAIDRFRRHVRAARPALVIDATAPADLPAQLGLDPVPVEAAAPANRLAGADALVVVGSAESAIRLLPDWRPAERPVPVLLALTRGSAGDLPQTDEWRRALYAVVPDVPAEPAPGFAGRFREATGLDPWPEARLTYRIAQQLLVAWDRTPSAGPVWPPAWWSRQPEPSPNRHGLRPTGLPSRPRAGLADLTEAPYPGRRLPDPP